MNCPPPNPFLSLLFAHDARILSQIRNITTQVIVLAPITSSLNLVDRDTGVAFVETLNDDFLASHILRVVEQPHERAKARNYSTINGKTVVIKVSHALAVEMLTAGRCSLSASRIQRHQRGEVTARCAFLARRPKEPPGACLFP